MLLKALELQGFKSFPEKIRLEFDRPITSVVGPNGSGKSNISDALSWVMGEQRAKAMRGAKMEDVIFSGGAGRGAVGFAQVSMVLDNSKTQFPVDAVELMITRRYYRSGESEYYINKRPVRLKDVNEMLMDTGLGRDGYSMIGQGRVDEILSAKSEDRRDVFEEAAGISKFRYRKAEAEGKLKHTEDNLLRAADKIAELELQVEPLREQAETAKRYLILRDELRSLEISLWLDSLEKLAHKNIALNVEYVEATETLERTKAQLELLYANAEDFSAQMREKELDAERVRGEISKSESDAALADSELASLSAQLEAERENELRLERERSYGRSEERIANLQVRLDEASASAKENEADLERAKTELDAAQNQIRGYELRITSRQTKADELTRKRNDAQAALQAARSRMGILEDMEREHEGFAQAVRTVINEGRGGRLRGIHGTVADVIRTEQKYALAVEIALGAALQNVIVDRDEDAKSAINMLKQRNAGRVTFLPMSTIRGQYSDVRSRLGGIEGIASDLVEYDERYAQIVGNLLGRTVIVDTMDTAIALSRENSSRLRIVTLDGQIINAGGSITGGSTGRSGGILSRASEIETLRARAAEHDATLKAVAVELSEAERELGAAKFELDAIVTGQREVREGYVRTEAVYTQAKRRIEELSNELRTETLEAEQRVKQLEAETALVKVKQEAIAAKISVATERKAQLAEQSARHTERLQTVLADKLEFEGRRTKAEREAQEANREIVNAERTFASLEQRKLSADLEEKQLLDKLWDTYELSRTAAERIRQDLPDNSPSKAQRRTGELKREIAALGVPNIGAIDEFERVNSRYVYLTEQRDDIQQAKNELLRVIRELTAEMENIFTNEFARINESFKATFVELFGGGRAELILEDESDPLNCGVEIKAQPPGKTLRSLSLLSGGERAFVAIALYFAIMKIHPTPFCVMDEIESALDEENVRRFAAYCRKMCDSTQFILITHRRGTMEGSDTLLGVTMQKGISTILHMNLEEALRV